LLRTLQQAANLLNISRPSLIKLLDVPEMSYHYAGTHRRVRIEDLMVYKARRDRAQKAALDEMLRDTQALSIYDLTDPSHRTVSY
jgi:excisionase family DNA binding protein